MNLSSNDSAAPERLALLPLLAMILLAPPEVHGLTLAGAAGLIVLTATVAWWRGRTRGWRLIGWALALVFPLVLLAPAPAVAAAPVAMFVLAAAFGLIGASASDSGRSIATTVAATATAVAAYGLWQRAFGLAALVERLSIDTGLPDRADLLDRAEAGRAFGTLTTPAALGGLLVLALPIAIGLGLTVRGRLRLMWFGAALVQFAGLVASASATAALALVLALGAAWWLAPRHDPVRHRVFVVGGLAVALALASIVAIRGPQILDAADPDSPLRLRAGNFRSAALMALDHPWLGVGFGGFAEFYPVYRLAGDNETRHVHNLPLEWIAETGFVAGGVLSIVFLAAFLVPFRRAMRARDRLPPWCRGVAVGLATFAIHNLGDFTAWMPSVLWTASALTGVVYVQTLTSSSASSAAPPRRDRRFRVPTLCGVASVIIAAAVMLATGFSRDARLDARFAAWVGDAVEAEQSARRATLWAPWDPDAAIFLARATLGSNETALAEPRRRLALERAERAVELVPMRAAARRARARARILLGDAPGAYADLAEAARLHPLHDGYRVERDGVAMRLNELADLAGRSRARREAGE